MPFLPWLLILPRRCSALCKPFLSRRFVRKRTHAYVHIYVASPTLPSLLLVFLVDRFGDDEKAGHGTHTAGTAAGSTINNPAETTDCEAGRTLSCAGACIDDAGGLDDDLVPYYHQVDDIDRICPFFGCDDSEVCLGDDVGSTLAENGGMAQGAKLAIFDAFAGETSLATYAGNDLWEPCLEAGCKIHSNSWGFDGVCVLSALDILYDEFMYKVSP